MTTETYGFKSWEEKTYTTKDKMIEIRKVDKKHHRLIKKINR